MNCLRFAAPLLLLTFAPLAKAQTQAPPSPDQPAPEASATAGSVPPVYAPLVTQSPPALSNITVRADEPMARLERQIDTTSLGFLPSETSLASVSRWETICVAPCMATADANGIYRISGEGLVPSSGFTTRGQDLYVEGDMGDSYERTGGAALVVLGAGGILVGGIAVIAVPIMESEDVGSPELRTGMLAGGFTVMGLGTIAAATGAFLWLSNDTEVVDEHGQDLAELEISDDISLTTDGIVF